MNQMPVATYIISLNLPHSDEKKYININNFKLALQKESDLSNLPQRNELCQIPYVEKYWRGKINIGEYLLINPLAVINWRITSEYWLCKYCISSAYAYN